MSFTPLTGTGTAGAYIPGDKLGAQTVEKIRTNFNDHETRILVTEAEGRLRWAEVSVSSSELLALRATPKTLVASPGAGKVLEFTSAVLLLDAATAYVESAANLSIRYNNTTGAKASDDIETTGFIDQSADTMTTARPKADVIVAKTGCENVPLVLHNVGSGEYTTGTGVMRVKVSYRVWTTGW
jgi:hypothetical protein